MTLVYEVDHLSTFGVELRRRRIEANRSLATFSKEIHYCKSHLSKVETGVKPPSRDFAQRCDAALHADGELARLARPRRGGGQSPPVAESDAHWSPTFWLPTPATPLAPDDPETLAECWHIFEHIRTLGQRCAPDQLVPWLARWTETLCRQTRHRQSLLFASRLAEFTGWMFQEMGDDDASIRWTNQAVRLAAAAGDQQLSAYRHVRLAEVALYRNESRTMIELAKLAQAEQSTPRVHGLAALREAQGHAIDGNYDECHSALDRAASFMDQSCAPDPALPTLGTSTVVNPIPTVRAWCMHDLGHPREAVDILTPEFGRIPPRAQRARARYGVRLALACASMHEIERSCALLEPLLETLPRLDSATIRTDLRKVAATLSRWASDRSVRAITPRITAALHPRLR
ncbi:MAG: helix-turn-helix domain-containing protein [Micromonosporaceae bacterium]|nr:helix-turn-helix domain-containing protein [Micromonosporaceae bacterium]